MKWSLIAKIIHFARMKRSPGDQVPSEAKYIYSILHHHVSGTWRALHKKMQLPVEQGGAESPNDLNYFPPSQTNVSDSISYDISPLSFIYSLIHLFTHSIIIEDYCVFHTV